MSKTVTIRLDDEIYARMKSFANAERRLLSNFIENAALNYLEETTFTDDLETMEVLSNKELVSRLKKGSRDAKERKGRFVE